MSPQENKSIGWHEKLPMYPVTHNTKQTLSS